MKEIPVKGGYLALVDDEDYEFVSAYSWTILKPARSLTMYARSRKDGKTIYMHRLIMSEPEGLVVDHLDGNGLNNQRSNLCPKTQQANVMDGLIRRDIAAWRAKRAAMKKAVEAG